ncbi:MAG: trypsin-like peptidase domain-containing protein [Bdellovibrionales bacterium]|nr:trypsin-like peptidase domain-containing protein [Bdellovibrionales bacterium]
MGGQKISAIVLSVLLLSSCGETTEPAPPDGSSELAPSISQYTLSPLFRPDVIYGLDDRLEYYQIQNPFLHELMDSTVALVQKHALKPLSHGRYKVSGPQYGSAYGLCLSEPYYEQPSSAFCSGFLVSPDLIATAGHCIRSLQDCQNTAFLFGFALPAPAQVTEIFEDNQVFFCSEVIESDIAANGSDYSLVRLDRPVMGRPPLRMRRAGEMAVGEDIFVLGHPAGLPIKYSGGAKVRTVKSEYYVANLDTYGGNSGSAVFNSQSGEVEGILVRGETDFVSRNGCRVSNICTNLGCRGEDFTKISHITRLLPQ